MFQLSRWPAVKVSSKNFIRFDYIFSFNNWLLLDRLFGPGFNIRTYVSIFFIAIIAGAGGINECVALWLRKDFKNNEIQNNFKTFLIITIIVNSFVSFNLRKIRSTILDDHLCPQVRKNDRFWSLMHSNYYFSRVYPSVWFASTSSTN